MEAIAPQQSAEAIRAGRAIGAMFFSIFGGVWIEVWSWRTLPGNMLMPAVVAALSLAILWVALSRVRQNSAALAAEQDSPERRRINRLFNIVNAGQWVLILIGVNVLNNMGLAAWAVPFAILIIGLHFLPLARLFNNPPHYVTGGLMILFAIAYPLLIPGGPSDPIGCLGAGLILWSSAIYALAGKARPAP
jgi:hypothetical protein